MLLYRLKKLLSNKYVSAAIIIAAIAGRIIQLVFFYNIRVDASFQVMATDNLLHGNGISTGEVFYHDLTSVKYTRLVNWPPGYSILLAPFYALFNHNYIWAGITLDIIAAAFLIFFSRKILQILNVPTHLLNIFTLITGFFIYDFYFIASSDAIAISVFIAAIYFALAMFEKTKHENVNAIAVFLCLLIAGSIKYLFMPVVAILPMVLILNAWRTSRKNLLKNSIVILVLLSSGLGFILFYFQSGHSAVGYVSSPQRGFYPYNLAGLYPFFTAAYINPTLLSKFTQTESLLLLWQRLSQVVSLLILIGSAVYALKYFKHLANAKSGKPLFLHLSFYLSAGIISILVFLSLTVGKEEILPGYLWTYVEEGRYYGLVILLVQMLTIILYASYGRNRRSRAKYLFLLLLLISVVELFRGMIFDVNRIRKWGKEEFSWQYEDRMQKAADSLIQKIQQQHPGLQVAVTGSSYYYNHRVSLYSHVSLLNDASVINNLSKIKSSSPAALLIILKNSIPYTSLPVAGHFDEYNFYVAYASYH